MQTIADFPSLRASEKLGDLCPCGCGGVKVLPGRFNFNFRTLAIALPCQICRAERIYHPHYPKDHRQYCKRCWPRRRPSVSPKPSDRFRTLLIERLDQMGITIEQACALAGFGKTTLSGWFRGNVPSRRSLEILASVLEAPWLVDALPSRTTHITLTCPHCGGIRTYGAASVRAWIDADDPDMDWEMGLGVRRCKSCWGRIHM